MGVAARLREARGEVIALCLLALAIVGLAVTADGGVPGSVWVAGLFTATNLALHATGIVLVHRSHGFLNFAQIAIGALGGTLFAVLAKADVPVRWVRNVCPPCLGDAPSPWVSWTTALLVGLALAAAVGFLFYVAVIRRFRSAPVLVPTVATIFAVQLIGGLRQPLINLLTTPQQRSDGVVNGPVTPPTDAAVDLLGLRVPAHELVFGIAVVLLLAGTAVLLARTRFGAALRASAERPERAQTLGVDVLRIHQRLWLVIGFASGLASTRAVMNGGIAVTDQSLVALSLVPILAVVVLARFESLGLVAIGATLLGVLYSVFQRALDGRTLLDGAMVLLITALLLVQRRRAVRTDQDVTGWTATRDIRPVSHLLRDLPEVVRWRRRGIAVLIVVTAGLPWVLSPSQASLATVAVLYAVVGLSLLVLTGWAGLVSLGQFAFAAVGGWVALALGLPVLVALPVGALAGGIVALVVGLPALRLRGLALAISTLALGVSVSLVLVNPRYLGSVVTGDVDRPVVLGLDLDDQRVAFYLAILVLGLAIAAVLGLRRSRTGRVLLASRENEVAVESLGVSLVRARLTAFAISGTMAAAAGVLFAYQQGGVRPDSFSPDVSLTLFAYVVMGGLGSIAGPLLGFTLFAIVSIASSAPWVVTFVSGFGGLLLLLTAPGGLVEVAVRGRDAVLRRIASRRRLRVPHLHELDDEERAPIQPRRTTLGGDDVAARRWSLSGQWTAPVIEEADDEPELVVASLRDGDAPGEAHHG